MNFVKKYAWCMYLGGALYFLGFSAFGWKYYAVMVPVCILVAISRNQVVRRG